MIVTTLLSIFEFIYHNAMFIIVSAGSLFAVIVGFISNIPWGIVLDVGNKIFSICKNAPEVIGKLVKKFKKKPDPNAVSVNLNSASESLTSEPTSSINTVPGTPSNLIVMSNVEQCNVVSKTTSKKVTRKTVSYADGSSYSEEESEEIITEFY